MARRFLVTGGAGFIGSSLARALLTRGDSVRVVDDFSSGSRANIADLDGRIELLEGDIRDEALMDRACTGVEVIFHEAAIPSVPRSLAAPVASHGANATGTLMVLEAARRNGVRRVVYAGSSSVYGETPTLPKVETMPTAPLSPYAVSKLTGELYCQVYARTFKLQTAVLRYFNVFGPRQDPMSQYAAVIPRFVTAALQGQSPTIYGDGTQSRDFCFIDNVIEANLLAADAQDASGRVFNVACAAATSLNDVIGLVARGLGMKLEAKYEPPRVGDIKHSLADISLARKYLGYTAAVPFAQGLERTIAWYRQKA